MLAAQVLGLFLADRTGVPPGAAPALGALGLAVGLVGCGRRTRAVAALLLACASGLQALGTRHRWAREDRPPAAFEASVEARVAGVRPTARGFDLELAAVRRLPGDAGGPGAPRVPRRLLLSLEPGPDGAAPALAPGTLLRARLRIAPERLRRNPGSARDPRRLARRGIAARARLVDAGWWVTLGPAGRASAGLGAARAALGERLSALGEGGALLRALAVGDPSRLSPVDREAFRRLGISHLLAVSGLHLALVAGGAFLVARRLLLRAGGLAGRRDVGDAARVAALGLAALYAGLCGFGVPVRRAWLLVAAWVVAALRARRSAPLHPLAGAALAVLALQPHALFEGGAQLSFAACAALIWGGRRAARAGLAQGAMSAPAGALRASSWAIAATAPLAAWHWGVAAPWAVIVNLVAIPWTAGVLLPAALLAATAGAIPGGLPWPLAWLLEGVARATLLAGRHAADWVPASGGVRPPALVWLAVAALAALALAARRPALAATWATLLGLALRCAPAAPYLPAPPRVVALDVGRGDAVVVQGRRGAVLVDGAAAHPGRFDLGRSAVLPALRALGVGRLDRVVATHADTDHRGGLPAVLRELPVDAVWLPPGGREDPAFDALRAAARARDVPVREVHRGAPPLRLGDLTVTPVWPPAALPGGGRNEASLGLRIDVASRRVLLLGDVGAAEAELVRAGEGALAADVLLLPHHGSRGSSSQALLRAVDPRVALLSAPCPASRGLPHPEALARVRATPASLWWTGRDGAVLVGLAPRLVVAPFAERDDCAAPRADAGGAP